MSMRNATAPGTITARFRNSDAILGTSLTAASLAFLGYTLPMPPDAAFWPRGVLLLLLLLGGVLAVRGLRSPAPRPQATEGAPGEGEWNRAVLRGPALTLLIVLGYAALVTLVGFFPATTLYLLAQLWFGGVRDPRIYLGVTAGLVGVVYLLFSYQLEVPLPTGSLFG